MVVGSNSEILRKIIERTYASSHYSEKTLWITTFSEEALYSFFERLMIGSDVSIVKDPSTIFTEQFSAALEGSLDDKLAFIMEGAQQEGLRVNNYMEYGSYLGKSIMEQLVNYIGGLSHRTSKAAQSLNDALVFRVQERLLVPFVVSQLLDVGEYDASEILNFLNKSKECITKLYLKALEVHSEKHKEANNQTIAQIKEGIKVLWRSDEPTALLGESSLPLIHAGRLGQNTQKDRIDIQYNGVDIGKIQLQTGTVYYLPRLRIFPFQWGRSDANYTFASR